VNAPKAAPMPTENKAVPEELLIGKDTPPDHAAGGVEPAVVPDDGAPAEAAPPPPPPPPPPMVATPFELRASSGDRVSLDSLKGNVIVVEFGGSWCLPCRTSRDELDGLLTRFGGKPVRVLALSCRDKSSNAAIDRFLQKSHQFPLLVGADAVAAEWSVRTYPSYFIVGLDGEIVKSDHAYAKGVTVSGLGDEIEKYLAARHPGGETPPSAPTAEESGPDAPDT